jgi:hypothetical protein
MLGRPRSPADDVAVADIADTPHLQVEVVRLILLRLESALERSEKGRVVSLPFRSEILEMWCLMIGRRWKWLDNRL